MPRKKPFVVGDPVRLANERGWRGEISEASQPGGVGTRYLYRVKWTKRPSWAKSDRDASILTGRGNGTFVANDLLPPGRTDDEKQRDAKRYPPPKQTKSKFGWTEVNEEGVIETFPPGTPYPKKPGVDPWKR